MLTTRHAGLIVTILFLILWVLPGCAGLRQDASLTPTADGSHATAFGNLLPAPSTLRQVSATEVAVDGADWKTTWPNNNVTAAGTEGLYSPAYEGANRDLEHLAYAVYSLSVSGFSGTPALHFYFTTEGAADSGWIAVCDYSKDRWDWYALPEPDSGHSVLDISLTNRTSASVMPVAVAFTGTQPWQLEHLQLGENMQNQPGEWPMSGRDRTNTHCITNSGPATNTLKWRFSLDGPGSLYSGLEVSEDDVIYAGNGSSLIAYDNNGNRLWDCSGVTPSTRPAIASDGTVYVGGTDPDPGLHAISSDGELLWSYSTSGPVVSNPVVGPDGVVYFGCDNAKFYGINPDGTLHWSKDYPSSVRSHPAVGADGSLYFGWMTADFNPVCHLVAFNPDHSEKWDNVTDKLARAKPAVGSDGSVYVIAGTSVTAYNANGSEKWSKTYTPSAYSTPLLASDGSLYFGSTEGNLVKLDSSGNQDWSYASDGEVIGGPMFNADGDVVACTMNGVLFGVNTSGAEQWSYTSGSTTMLAPGVSSTFTCFATEDGYLNAILPSGDLDWRIGAGGTVQGSPAVADDGTVYIGGADGVLYALRSNGTVKWRYNTGGDILGSPAIGQGGTVYVGSDDWKLHAITPAGAAVWQFETTSLVESNPVIGDDGTIYFGCNNSYMYAVRADGTEKWKIKAKYLAINGAPAVDGSGRVYFAAMDRYIHAVTSYGTEDWTYKGDGSFKGGVVIGADNTIYAGCEKDTESGVLYALNVSGSKKWSYNTSGPIRMCPAISSTGAIIVATSDGTSAKGAIYALTTAGGLKWQYTPASCLGQGVAVDKDGVIYAGMQDGKVCAITDNTSSGTLKWSYELPGYVFYTPAVVKNCLIIGANSNVIAIGE